MLWTIEPKTLLPEDIFRFAGIRAFPSETKSYTELVATQNPEDPILMGLPMRRIERRTY